MPEFAPRRCRRISQASPALTAITSLFQSGGISGESFYVFFEHDSYKKQQAYSLQALPPAPMPSAKMHLPVGEGSRLGAPLRVSASTNKEPPMPQRALQEVRVGQRIQQEGCSEQAFEVRSMSIIVMTDINVVT